MNQAPHLHSNEFVLPWKSVTSNAGALTLLVLIIAVDLVFIFLHFLLEIGVLNDESLSLARDRGTPETYQYVKELFITVLLYQMFRKTREIGLGIWCLLFLYLLIDDAFKLHEGFGRIIADSLNIPAQFGLEPYDFGEVLVSVAAAVVFLSSLAICYKRHSDSFRHTTKRLVLLLLALAFFGVFIDIINAASATGSTGIQLLVVLEDGGEMIVMSLILFYVYLRYMTDMPRPQL